MKQRTAKEKESRRQKTLKRKKYHKSNKQTDSVS